VKTSSIKRQKWSQLLKTDNKILRRPPLSREVRELLSSLGYPRRLSLRLQYRVGQNPPN